ncbi:hypothetical protein AB0J52_26160, partial [Spirillospora sp. NPDC049652]
MPPGPRPARAGDQVWTGRARGVGSTVGLVTRRPRPDAAVRLLCFPHAGGGAAAYAGWPDALGPDIE